MSSSAEQTSNAAERHVGQLTSGELNRRLKGPGLYWELGPFVARLRSPLPEIAQQVAFLYSAYRLSSEQAVIDFDVSVQPAGWRRHKFNVYVNGGLHFGRRPRPLVVPMLEWVLNYCQFQLPHRCPQWLMLHSATIERDGRATLIPAPPGSGKSTLCAALVHRGWRLLSDETALFLPDRGEMLPVPRPINLKEASIELIRRFAPEAQFTPLWYGTAKGTVAHVRAPDESVQKADVGAAPAFLVFPRYTPNAAPKFTTLSKGTALLQAARNAFNYSELGTAGFHALADMIDRCECYEFVFSDLDAAVAAFGELYGLAAPVKEGVHDRVG